MDIKLVEEKKNKSARWKEMMLHQFNSLELGCIKHLKTTRTVNQNNT